MVTLLQFKARFPEFQNVPDPTLQDAIARGYNEASSAVFGNLQDEAATYLAAHKLALSPYGQQARLAPGAGDTVYMTHYKRLLRLKAVGWARVSGCGFGNPWGCP